MLFGKVGTVAARPGLTPVLVSSRAKLDSFSITGGKPRHYTQPRRVPLRQFDKLKQPIQKPT